MVNNLKEDIRVTINQGKFAIAFHRTNSEDFINTLVNEGFFPAKRGGDMYGAGWYFCYEESDQMSKEMEHYGHYILKCKILLDGCILWDKKVAQIIYPTETVDGKEITPWSIPMQIKRICPEAFEEIPWDKWHTNVFTRKEITHYKERGFTSGLAHDFTQKFRHRPWFYNKINGMAYSGATDSRCLVMYNFHGVFPLGIRNTMTGSISTYEVDWVPFQQTLSKCFGPDITSMVINDTADDKKWLRNFADRMHNKVNIDNIDTTMKGTLKEYYPEINIPEFTRLMQHMVHNNKYHEIALNNIFDTWIGSYTTKDEINEFGALVVELVMFNRNILKKGKPVKEWEPIGKERLTKVLKDKIKNLNPKRV